MPFLKIIACEIAFREICHVAAHTESLLDVEFLTQGLHDIPRTGGQQIQQRIDGVPPGKYDAILVGYGLCGNLISGLEARHTPLVIPRAHDCITFFLGSKERYAKMAEERVGAYYYTSGWLECLQRRGPHANLSDPMFLPTRAGMEGDVNTTYQHWVKKYGEERARFLSEMMDEWTQHYTHGLLIDFDFAKPLRLDGKVKAICGARGWHFEKIPGDLKLLQHWVDGRWDAKDFLIVPPGAKVKPSYNDGIIAADEERPMAEPL